MSLAHLPPGAPLAARKAALVAESARVRAGLRLQLAPAVRAEAPMERLLASAQSLLGHPLVLGATVVGLVAIGPRRVFRLLRWSAMTLPFHPLGRRLIPMLGERLLSLLDTLPRGR